MSRSTLPTDGQWTRIELLMPSSDGSAGRPFRDHRSIAEGIIYRFRAGIPWRDVPEYFSPWQTARDESFPGHGVSVELYPERSDTVANRKRRGRNGGRTIGRDKEAYKRRNVVERSFNTSSSGAASPPATTNSSSPTAAESSSRHNHLVARIRRHALSVRIGDLRQRRLSDRQPPGERRYLGLHQPVPPLRSD